MENQCNYCGKFMSLKTYHIIEIHCHLDLDQVAICDACFNKYESTNSEN